MRPRGVVLLAAFVLLAATAAVSALAPRPQSLTTRMSSTSARRLLRAATRVVADDEERVDHAAVSMVAAKLSHPVEIIFKYPARVVEALELQKAGGKLDDNPLFVGWLKYAKQHPRESGLSSVVGILMQHKSDEELVRLFESLRASSQLKSYADELLVNLALKSPTSSSMVNAVWLNARETPDNVYKILQVEKWATEKNPKLVQWLRYTEQYRAQMGRKSYTVVQTLNVLLKSGDVSELNMAIMLQRLKQTPELTKLAGNMQIVLFQTFIKKFGLRPLKMVNLLEKGIVIETVTRSDPRFQVMQAYTLQYARKNGKATIEKVEKLFAADDPIAAAKAAEIRTK